MWFGSDDYQGAYDLARHLLELGHRRIVSLYDPFLSAWLVGYRNALCDANIEAAPSGEKLHASTTVLPTRVLPGNSANKPVGKVVATHTP